MKLEVGMYVRTKHHGILKYGDRFLFDDDILKASHNIIDLIEVGDYVNGYRVSTIDYENRTLYREYDDDFYFSICKEKDIKSIVTKEQFEQMKYKVGE